MSGELNLTELSDGPDSFDEEYNELLSYTRELEETIVSKNEEIRILNHRLLSKTCGCTDCKCGAKP